MKNREKTEKKARKRKRAKTADGVRCNADPDTSPVKSLFTERPKWPNSNEQSDSDGRQPIIRRAAGTSTFFAPGFIRWWNIFTVESQIEANPALGSVPARNATNFGAAVKSGRRIMRETRRFASRKILGIFYSTARWPCLTINYLVITGFLKTRKSKWECGSAHME